MKGNHAPFLEMQRTVIESPRSGRESTDQDKDKNVQRTFNGRSTRVQRSFSVQLAGRREDAGGTPGAGRGPCWGRPRAFNERSTERSTEIQRAGRQGDGAGAQGPPSRAPALAPAEVRSLVCIPARYSYDARPGRHSDGGRDGQGVVWSITCAHNTSGLRNAPAPLLAAAAAHPALRRRGLPA
eukprot:gene10662-biopygen11074